MAPLRLIRVIATFLLTFAMGGIAGWQLKPSVSPLKVGVGRIEASAEGALEKLGERLKLAEAQKVRLLPIFMEWSRQAERAGRRQRRRLELFEQNTPAIREVLTEVQRPEFDRLVEEAHQRFRVRLQRNGESVPNR